MPRRFDLSDSDESFEFDARYDRDAEREPVQYASPASGRLSPRGTLRERFDPDRPPLYDSWLTVLRKAGLLVFIGLLAACPDAPPPCAAVGCPIAPSASPHIWTPCTTTICFCRAQACRKGTP